MMQVTKPPPLVVDGLIKTYPGGVRAVRGISFEVTDGEIFGLLGPNGGRTAPDRPSRRNRPIMQRITS